MDNDSVIKWVYCNYRGRVTVYDIHGQKVHELSGILDYDKYLEIERRTDPEITLFDGLDDYRCIACELKKKKEAESTNTLQALGGGGGNLASGTNNQIIASSNGSLPQNGKYRGEILRYNGDVYVWDGYNWNKIKSSQSSNILSSTSTTKRMPSPPVFSPVLNPISIKKDSTTDPSIIKDIFNSEPFKKESHREERIANRKGSWWRDLFSK